MFRKFHEKLKEHEEGFTLIELLVVILIIAILAAIAIPVFLRQREKGWVSQMESALKNATTAAESYNTGTGNGSYAGLNGTGTAAADPLPKEGFKKADQVVVDKITAAASAYCVQVSHLNFTGVTYAISSEVTTPKKGATCDANGVLKLPAA